ncbi:MAG: YchF/TatD family DNA exonuclease [Planctomycetes bacterium]|nr:YchF/TatD family DNA exonuclease [Planctomycetota bacterium]
MIDTHCHLTFPELHTRLDEVLAGAASAGVDRMITIATTPADAVNAQAIAEAHPQVHFACGVHPHYAINVALNELPPLIARAGHDKCVAFGEMGIDYHYPDPPPAVQHEMFQAQLELIRYSEMTKPIILHCRKAVDDTIGHINASGLDPRRFVFHCCTEHPAEVRKILDLGSMISFTGVVTYKNAPEVRESALLVPDGRIMIETDAPYLTPEPHRKIRPNEPKFVPATAAFLADLRGMSLDDFIQLTDANARRFFQF